LYELLSLKKYKESIPIYTSSSIETLKGINMSAPLGSRFIVVMQSSLHTNAVPIVLFTLEKESKQHENIQLLGNRSVYLNKTVYEFAINASSKNPILVYQTFVDIPNL
jgi:hypothetical protein